MRLKRLELFGFKSFADRTTLTFDHTLTGIVGPNGCGKSNVVDAIRWVLGETRPTSMRGGEMSDVIFKGSVSRPAMSVAEVALVLDNADGRLEGQGAEIGITRRVYSSGEGEYLIDGERVRLKDVRDLLFDTGLGSRGYAVLEQGRIDAVLSANPVDRRSIFEEAAGISRYRQRRKETESRLKRVEQDMLRLDDVLRELGTRLRSLKIQAGKAERFVLARDAWRLERARYVRHRLLEQRSALTELAAEIGTLEQRSNELRGVRSGEEGDARLREDQQRVLSDEVDRQSGEVARLAAEARGCDERHANLLARASAGERSAEEESTRALELASQLEVREADLERLSAEVVAREQSLEVLVRGLNEEEARARAARSELEQVRERSQVTGAEALRLLGELTEAQNTVRHLEGAREVQHERAARLDERLESLRAAVSELRERADACSVRMQAAERELAVTEARVAGLRTELDSVSSLLESAGRERVARELERAKLESRIESLRDWEREREGLEAGARDLFAALEAGDAPCDAGALAGLVADHLRTSTHLARALDTALGADALALVVRDAQDAGRIAAWLQGRRGGLVRMNLPATLDAAAGEFARDWRSELGSALAARVGGALLDSVEVDAGYEAMARLLVGDVLVVADRDTALAVVAAAPRWRCVTPEGELVDALGMVGGHREIAQGAVGRRASASELERELEGTRAELERLDRVVSEHSQRRVALEGELRAASEELAQHSRAHEQARGEARTAGARLADQEEGLDLAERERAQLAGEAQALEQDLEQARKRFEEGRAGHARASAELAEHESARHRSEERLAELRTALAQLQSEGAGGRAELDGLRQRAGDLERVCADARRELERARRLVQEHGEAARGAREEAERVRAEGDRWLASRAEAGERLEALRESERAGRVAMETFRQRADAVTRELESLQDQLTQQRLREQRIELERAELEGRAREDLGLGEDDLLEGFEPEPELAEAEALGALGARVAELRRLLDGIGPVNTEAMDEHEEARLRFEFLDVQRKDLVDSKHSLDRALASIKEESLRLFQETFVEVRGHFQTLFRQLFGGGRADLTLEEGADPLEAGIEISARPPGREMLPIGLLSGGQRTMTALALLFAVFRSRPSPFSVLDEVDAALDDANVGRFLAMVDSFLQDSQFIVVTHNKGTMSACDALYGITMETKGVSTHVAVEFGDVDRFVPEAQGDAGKVASARAEVAQGSSLDLEEDEAEVLVSEQVAAPGPASEPVPEPVAVGGLDAESGEPIVELEPRPAPAPEDVVARDEVPSGR